MTINHVLFYDEIESPIGPIVIVVSEKGICKIHFGESEAAMPSLKAWARKLFLSPELVRSVDRVKNAAEQLQLYFKGELADFDVSLDLQGTPFQQKVWQELLNVQYGETKSYKDIAQAINAPKAVRAIGGAVNRNPIPVIIPCHRIIGSNGELVGYNGGLDKKQKLLDIEKPLEIIS